MKYILEALIAVLLILIIYQDFKYRAIVWIAFPLLFTSFLISTVIKVGISQFTEYAVYNFNFLVMLFLGITLYFSVKARKVINLTKGYFGWADILFLACLAVLFSPLNFLLFFHLSIFLMIVAVLLFRIVKNKKFNSIPYAGMQALVLLVLLLFNTSFSLINFLSDEWIVNYFL
jgi:hypothetical protein